jgi:hypothetical protein
MTRFALAFGAAIMLFAGAGIATPAGVSAMLAWKKMNACAEQAQVRYPDVTDASPR